MKTTLSIRDGFQFGCGFFLASLAASLIMSFVVLLLAALVGGGLLGGLLRLASLLN